MPTNVRTIAGVMDFSPAMETRKHLVLFVCFEFFAFFNMQNVGESLTANSGASRNGPNKVQGLRVVTSGL